METHVEPRPAGLLVRLVGEGTITAADDLNAALEQVVQARPTLVVVDMSALTFASSMVMGALVQFRARLKADGGVLKLAALQPGVATAFERARLAWVIPTFPTVEQAFDFAAPSDSDGPAS